MRTTEILLRQQIQATALIRAGMRITLVHAMTNVSIRALRDIWQDWYGSDTPAPGRLRNNALSYIKQGESVAQLSMIVAIYFAIEKTQQPTLPEAFTQAWESVRAISSHDYECDLDINAAWYAIRDVKAGLIAWVECQNCKGQHLYDTEMRKTSNCPYCGKQHPKQIKVTA